MLLKKKFIAISKASSQTTGRYQTNGVHVTRSSKDKCRIEATDGHRLIRVDFPDPKGNFPDVGVSEEHKEKFEAIVPRETWERAGKAIARGKGPFEPVMLLEETRVDGQVLLATSEGCKFLARPDSQEFPDIDKILPTVVEFRKDQLKKEFVGKKPHVRIAFNAVLLAETLLAIAKIEDGKANNLVTLFVPTEEGHALLIQAKTTDDESITSVVMPCRE